MKEEYEPLPLIQRLRKAGWGLPDLVWVIPLIALIFFLTFSPFLLIPLGHRIAELF